MITSLYGESTRAELSERMLPGMCGCGKKFLKGNAGLR
jgi:hypothetical protein